MVVQKLYLAATSDADPDRQMEFTLDVAGAVSGLKLPKAEKGVEADICSQVADMVEGMVTA